MKKILLSLFTGMFIAVLQTVSGQVSQLSWTFDDGNTEFTVINADAANPSYSLSVTDGILKVDVDKKTQDWSFLQKFNIQLDLSSLPTLQFKVRSEGGAPISFNFKDDNDVAVKVTHTPTTAADMELVFIDLSTAFDSNSEFLKGNIKELQIEISNGYNVTTSDAIYFDFIKLGFTEPMPLGGKTYEQSFNAGLPPNVTDDTKYSTSSSDGAMSVNVHSGDRWQALEIGLDAVYDFSDNPVINIKIRTENAMNLQCFLIDEDGNGFKTVFVDAQYDHYDLVDGANEFRQVKVFPDDDFTTVSYDFSSANSSIVDLSRIISIKLCANGTSSGFEGDFYIDHIWAGTGVEKTAYIGQIDEVSIYKNKGGEQKILIPEVKNAASIVATGAESLIKNIRVDAVSYSDFTENGHSQTYGYTNLIFELETDATGTDTVVLSATGAGEYGDFVEKFALTVTDNQNPEIDAIDDILSIVSSETSILLTGLSDGDAEAKQDITLAVSSDNEAVIATGSFDYTQGYQTAELKFTPLLAGRAVLTVSVNDDEGASTEVSFTVDAYDELNTIPEVNPLEDLSIVNNSGATEVILSGLSDGDGMTQNLSVTAVSSDPTIVPNPVVNYTPGENTATLSIDPVDTETGDVTITVTVTDDGGNASNQGDLSTSIDFVVSSIAPYLTGYTVDLTDPDVLSLFGESGTYTLSIVDYDGEKALKIVMNSKSTWDGIVLSHPELNLIDNPLVSYDIYTETADPTLYHWNYLYDVNGERCILNSNDHKYEAPLGQWTSLSFDYRQEGDMSTAEGVPIDASRIDYLLINMHNSLVGWPQTEIDAVCYMKNIKLGDQAEVPTITSYATIDNVPDQSVYEGADDIILSLSGISNGKGGIENVVVTASSSNTAVSQDPVVGTLQNDGTAALTLTAEGIGSSDITVTVSADGSETSTMNFKMNVLDTYATTFSKVIIDRSVKNQTIRGIGTFYNEPRWLDLYVDEMGASAVRLGVIGNQWEPVNDNDDPNLINMQGFNYDAFDWQYMRDLKAAGIESFILTSWSPPAWMKRSLTLDHTNQAITWELTDNILEPYYYEEFAESMAALVKAFKEEADIDLLAIGLQNEPFFNEPYASAILGPDQFTELIEIVGDRFAAEGLSHVGFYMPEQVFGMNTYSMASYISNVRSNPVSDAYTDYIGVHGYDGTGVDSNFPDYSGWRNLFDAANTGDNPKELWMTETHIAYDDFSSALAVAGAIHGSLWAGNINLWTNWSFGDMQLTKNVPNSSFYATKQFAKYIRPGAVRVDSESDNGRLLVSAYENIDGSFVMVVLNTSSSPISSQFSGAQLPEAYQLVRTSQYENALEIGNYSVSKGPAIFPAMSITTMIATDPVILSMIQPDNILLADCEGEQQIVISGISNEEGGTDNLTLEYTLDNPSIVDNVSLGGISSNGEAVLTFSPSEGEGQTKVTLTLSDDKGNSREDAFYITVEICESAENILMDQKILVYPNPTEGLLNIELPGEGYESLKLMDISGKTLKTMDVDTDFLQLDLSDLEKGLYLLELKGSGGKLIEQVIIQ